MTSQPVPSIFLSVLHCRLGLGELQACLFPDVVFPPFFLSASFSAPFRCALQNGFGQTWRTGDMFIPLQFASIYDGQEVFVWSDCLLSLGTDFLVGNTVFVWDAVALPFPLRQNLGSEKCWKWAKYVKLCCNLLQTWKREPLIASDFSQQQMALICAFEVSHCWYES